MSIKAEARHLEEVVEADEEPESSYILIGGLALVLIPVFLVMLGAALLAYYGA